MPRCKRCGHDHYNFVACANVIDFERKQLEKQIERERRKVIPMWRPDPREWRPGGPTWGETRLSNVLNHDGPEAA